MPVADHLEVEIRARDFASRVLKRIGTSAEKEGARAEAAFNRVGGSVQRATAGLARYAAGFASVAVAVSAVRKGVRDYLEFEKAITEVRTILDEQRFSLARVRQEVLDLSLALGENETVIARGFYQTLSAGITDAADATKVLTAASELAVAGLSRTEVTVDAITTVINAYGKSADDAARISDVLFKSVELGKTRVDELGSSLGNVIPFAAELGVSFEEVSAAIVDLTKSGKSTSEAVTGVRAAIVALLRRRDDIDALFRKTLGRGFSSADIKARGLVAVLNDLRRATGGNADQLTELLGRVEAVGAALSLTKDDGRGFFDVLEQIEGASGATGAALDKQLASPAKKLQIILGGVRQGLIGIGESFVTAFVDAGTSIHSATEAAKFLRKEIEDIGAAARVTAGVLLLGIEGFRALRRADPINQLLREIRGGATTTKEAIDDLEKAIRAITAKRLLGIDTAQDAENLRRAREELENLQAVARATEVADLQDRLIGLGKSARGVGDAIRNVSEAIDSAGGVSGAPLHLRAALVKLRRRRDAIVAAVKDIASELDDLGEEAPAGAMRRIFRDLGETAQGDEALKALGLLRTALSDQLASMLEDLRRGTGEANGRGVGADLAASLFAGFESEALRRFRARNLPIFDEITTTAEQRGVELPEALLAPLRVALQGLGGDAAEGIASVGEGLADGLAPAMDATAKLEASIEALKSEVSVLGQEVRAGIADPFDLAAAKAELAEQAFTLLGEKGELSAEQARRAIEAVRRELENTARGTVEFQEQFAQAFGINAPAIAALAIEAARQARESLSGVADDAAAKLEDLRATAEVLNVEMQAGFDVTAVAADNAFQASVLHFQSLQAEGKITVEELERVIEALRKIRDEQASAAQAATWFSAAFQRNAAEMFDAAKVGERAANELFRVFDSGLTALSRGLVKGQLDFHRFAQKILEDIAAIALKSAILRALGSAFGFNASSFFFGQPPTPAAEHGGAVTGRGVVATVPVTGGLAQAVAGMKTVPMRAFASGGIVDRPTLALFGEGSAQRHGEAFVPLGPGRRIPVEMRGSGSAGAVNAEVNLTVNALDPRTAAQVLMSAETREAITAMVAESLQTGASRELITSVREAAR